MIDTKQFLSAVKQISDEKGIPEKEVIETIEAAIAAAYKRDYGKRGQIVRVTMNAEIGTMEVRQVFHIVEGVDDEGYITGALPERVKEERGDVFESGPHRPRDKDAAEGSTESVESGEVKIKFNPEKHITLADAKKKKAKGKVGEELIIDLEPKSDFGRIAAQTAKQVITQRLREAEREAIFAEFKDREGELVSGVVQRREGALVFVDISKTNGIVTPTEQMPNDNYRIGQRYRFLILRVEETPRGPVIVLSRAHPRLVHELFRLEVPEIDTGAVEIKAIAREAGSRTKVAVSSREEGVDPIGSLVGQRGVRVQAVINELSGEKIDIIQWSEIPMEFVAHALSPAKILDARAVDEERRHALVEVSDDQFSLAIGKRGQNVRLAAKLTGWKIDVRSPKEKLGFSDAGNDADSAALAPSEGTTTQGVTEETGGKPKENSEGKLAEEEESVKKPEPGAKSRAKSRKPKKG